MDLKKNNRYMVANKKLKQGELILKESPKLVGPHISGALICFKCCQNLKFDRFGYDFCKSCQKAVVCKKPCQGLYHTPEECSALKSFEIEGQTIAENGQILFALRCILIQKYDPEMFENIMRLEPHLEKRRDTLIWRRHRLSVERVLFENGCLKTQDIESETVQKICGIIDVNSFEIRPPRQSIIGQMKPEYQNLRGVYIEAAMMAHDCLANTHLSVDDDFTLSVYAAVDIEEGTPIFFNYANAFHGTLLRKEHLREGKYFECNCKRCKDPTELDTDLSSLRCHKCRKGLIRPCQQEKVDIEWKCNECQSGFKEKLIVLATDEARRKIDDVDTVNIEDMEALLIKLSQTFHSNHFLILELIQNLVGAYSLAIPNRKNLSRKIELCKRVLEVFNKIEPGLSRMRAITLYELQSAMVNLSHKKYRDGEISIETLVSELLYAESILKESIKLLLHEPVKSPEGRMAQNALPELRMIRTSISNIQRDFLTVNEKGSESGTKKQQKTKIKNIKETNNNEIKECLNQEICKKEEEQQIRDSKRVDKTEVVSKKSKRRKNKNK